LIDTDVPYRVKLLHNENEYEFPNCGELYCPYDVVKKLYAEALSCDFDKMCSVPSVGSPNGLWYK
jgi:hypothetical protein